MANGQVSSFSLGPCASPRDWQNNGGKPLPPRQELFRGNPNVAQFSSWHPQYFHGYKDNAVVQHAGQSEGALFHPGHPANIDRLFSQPPLTHSEAATFLASAFLTRPPPTIDVPGSYAQNLHASNGNYFNQPSSTDQPAPWYVHAQQLPQMNPHVSMVHVHSAVYSQPPIQIDNPNIQSPIQIGNPNVNSNLVTSQVNHRHSSKDLPVPPGFSKMPKPKPDNSFGERNIKDIKDTLQLFDSAMNEYIEWPLKLNGEVVKEQYLAGLDV